MHTLGQFLPSFTTSKQYALVAEILSMSLPAWQSIYPRKHGACGVYNNQSKPFLENSQVLNEYQPQRWEKQAFTHVKQLQNKFCFKSEVHNCQHSMQFRG